MIKIKYNLTRSNRKTIAIYIKDGIVDVRAPHRAPIESIERFIMCKESWIIEKQSHTQNRVDKRESFEINYGSKLLYRGFLVEVTQREGRNIEEAEASEPNAGYWRTFQ